MNDIDLSPIYSNTIDHINIDTNIEYDSSYYENMNIVGFKQVKFQATITNGLDDNLVVTGKLKVEVILEDSISLEPVIYDFLLDIDQNIEENAKKDENTLDLKEFLWENIVLEIPLRFTTVEDLSKFRGDGWKLISEDDIKTSNPFNELLDDLEKE